MKLGNNNILPIGLYLFLATYPLDFFSFLPFNSGIIHYGCENWWIFTSFDDLDKLNLS